MDKSWARTAPARASVAKILVPIIVDVVQMRALDEELFKIVRKQGDSGEWGEIGLYTFFSPPYDQAIA
jgi:hypothetical protein